MNKKRNYLLWSSQEKKTCSKFQIVVWNSVESLPSFQGGAVARARCLWCFLDFGKKLKNFFYRFQWCFLVGNLVFPQPHTTSFEFQRVDNISKNETKFFSFDTAHNEFNFFPALWQELVCVCIIFGRNGFETEVFLSVPAGVWPGRIFFSLLPAQVATGTIRRMLM